MHGKCEHTKEQCAPGFDAKHLAQTIIIYYACIMNANIRWQRQHLPVLVAYTWAFSVDIYYVSRQTCSAHPCAFG